VKRELLGLYLQKNSFFGTINIYSVYNIQDYNFACDFVSVRNLVSDTMGGT
jgi:hypothetical protein